MTSSHDYVLGQSARAARRLEIQDAHFGEVSERLLDELALKPNDRVVEFGCGPGGFSRRILRRLGAGGVLVGVDYSEGLLVQAKSALAGLGPAPFEPVLANVSQLGSWLDGADVVVGRTMLHHIPMVEIMLGRLRTMLRAGTRVGFLEPDFRSPLARLAHLESTGRPELAPLRVWATAISQLYAARRISPAVGATLAAALEAAGCRRLRWGRLAGRSGAPVLADLVGVCAGVRAPRAERGVGGAEESAGRRALGGAGPAAALPRAGGMSRVAAEA